jgi:hypothetical protein
MSDFDPTQHPRGNANNDGQFALKTQSRPETVLTTGTQIRLTGLDDLETITAVSLGQDVDGPIKCVDVRLNDFHDGVIGEPYTLLIEPIAGLNLTGLQPKGMSEGQWVQKLDDHYPAVLAFLEDRYTAGIDLPDVNDGEGLGWDQLEAHFRLDIPARDITREEAFDIGWNQTKAVQLYNESDHGTYGTENLGRLLNDAMDDAVILPGERYDVVREAEGAALQDVDVEIRTREGEREIRDVTAVAIAQHISGQRGKWFRPQELTELRRLGRHGWVNRQALRDELRVAWDSTNDKQERLRIDMMSTWLEHGGDNK